MTISSNAVIVTSNSANVAGNGSSSLAYHSFNTYLFTDSLVSPAFSTDGKSIMFDSDATNFLTADANGGADIFIKNLTTGSLSLVSATSAGVQANAASSVLDYTSNLGKVLFSSAATNLAVGAVNGHAGLYLKDMSTGSVVEVDTTAAGVQGNSPALADTYNDAEIFTDGNRVLFETISNNLTASDNNIGRDVFIKTLSTGAVTLVSSSSTGEIGNKGSNIIALSADNSKVWFSSSASNLVSGDANNASDIFIKDVSTGLTTVVSSSSAGVVGNSESTLEAISSDYGKALFVSTSTNLASGVASGHTHLYVKTVSGGGITVVDAKADGTVSAGDVSLREVNSDLTKVIFTTSASNLVAADTNAASDIFLKNTSTGALTLISGTSAGVVANASSEYETANSDFSKVVFQSGATNLAGGTTGTQVYIKSVATGQLTLVSSSSAGVAGNADAEFVSMSQDGSKILFSSAASNLVAGDTNGSVDLFMKDLATGATTRISNAPAAVANDEAYVYGGFVANDSKIVYSYELQNYDASNAAVIAKNGVFASDDLFIYDVAGGASTVIAHMDSYVSGTSYHSGQVYLGGTTPDGSKLIVYGGFYSGNAVTSDYTIKDNVYLVPLSASAAVSARSIDAMSADATITVDGNGALRVNVGGDVAILSPIPANLSFTDGLVATASASAIVDGYESFFHRAPTAAELGVWSSALSSGTTLAAFNKVLANDTSGKANEPALVKYLYDGYFGRDPSSSETTYWSGALQSGAASLASLNTTLANDGAGKANAYLSIKGLYDVYLGRDPGVSEVSYWSGALKAGTYDLRGFELVLAAQAGASANAAAYVTQAYKTWLGHAPSTSDLSYWTGQFNDGALTPLQLRQALINDASGQAYISSVITADYTADFGRAATSAEITTWKGLIANGAGFVTLTSALLGDGGGTTARTITATYDSYFGRDPTNSEMAVWRGMLTSGTTQASMRATLVNDASGQAHTVSEVGTLYQEYFGRAATTSEVNVWKGLVANGSTFVQLHDALIGDASGKAYAAAEISPLYQAIEGRAASTAEVNYWTGVFNSGASNLDTFVDTLLRDGGSKIVPTTVASGHAATTFVDVLDTLVINGFAAGDQVNFHGAVFDSYNPLDHAVQVNGDVLIYGTDATHFVLLENIQLANLTAANFMHV